MPDLNTVLVTIPARNEALTIGTVIAELRSQGFRYIRVVDNGSTDATAECANAAGAEVCSEPIAGYGRACWQGLQAMPPQIEWILFCDGDGSDDLSQLPLLLAQCSSHDLILGDRTATAAGRAVLTPAQRFGNGLATTLIAWGWRYAYRDLGPLRLIRRSVLDQIQMGDRGFGWTVEMQVRALEIGARVREVPVNYQRRQGGTSKISGSFLGSIQAGWVILRTLAVLYSRRPSRSRLWLWVSSLGLVMGCVLMQPYGDFRNAAVFAPFWFAAAAMGLGYIASWEVGALSGIWFWAVTLITRLVLLGMYPGDDIWRYVWEGYIQTFGYSPFDLAPNSPVLATLRPEWWGQINWPEVTAIYPPVAQLGFRILASIAPTVLLFKIAFVVADVGICGLLSRRFGYSATLIYAWNPMVLYSFAGGGHYDSWFLLPLVAAWLWFDAGAGQSPRGDRLVLTSSVPQSPRAARNRAAAYFGSAFFLGVSVAVKWMSLPIASFLVWHKLRRWQWRGALLGGVLSLIPLGLAAIPFCRVNTCPLIPTGSVFVAYGRSAEFLPYWVAQVWDYSRWHNWVYLVPLAIAGLLLLWRSRRFGPFTEGYFISLLLLSPIVHAWYLTWLVPFAVASRNWGTRWVSLSGFVYFVLPYRMALGNPDWFLTPWERWLLWLPFILGWVMSCWQLPTAQK